jgi:hypothetical protein
MGGSLLVFENRAALRARSSRELIFDPESRNPPIDFAESNFSPRRGSPRTGHVRHSHTGETILEE